MPDSDPSDHKSITEEPPVSVGADVVTASPKPHHDSSHVAPQKNHGSWWHTPLAVTLIGSALGAGVVELGGWCFQQKYLEQREARADFRRRAETFQARFADKAGAYLYASDRLIAAHSDGFTGPDSVETLRIYNDVDAEWGRAEEGLLSELQRVFTARSVHDTYTTAISTFSMLDDAVDSLEVFPMSQGSHEHSQRVQEARTRLSEARDAMDSLNAMILRAVSAGN